MEVGCKGRMQCGSGAEYLHLEYSLSQENQPRWCSGSFGTGAFLYKHECGIMKKSRPTNGLRLYFSGFGLVCYHMANFLGAESAANAKLMPVQPRQPKI